MSGHAKFVPTWLELLTNFHLCYNKRQKDVALDLIHLDRNSCSQVFKNFLKPAGKFCGSVPCFLNLQVFNLRSSHRRCSVRKGVLRNFAKFTVKHLCQSLFFNFVKKETLAQVFFCEFCEISKSTFLQNTFGRLVLQPVALLKKEFCHACFLRNFKKIIIIPVFMGKI